MKAEQLKKALRTTTEDLDPNKEIKPEVQTVTGKEAEKIADKPRYTGDSEFDRIEREETDVFREPFDVERFRTDGG